MTLRNLYSVNKEVNLFKLGCRHLGKSKYVVRMIHG